MLASPADGSDGEIAPTLIRACVMDLLDLRTLCALAGKHTIARCAQLSIAAAVDVVE